MSDEEQTESVGTRNNDRIAALASISDHADEERAESLEDVVVAGNYKLALDDDGNVIGGDEDPQPIVEEKPVQPRKMKIKVLGKEMELTEEELIERAQKVEAADQYLAEASKRLRETTQPQQPVKQDAAQRERSIALARALQMGTEEEAADVIEQLSQAPSFRPDDIAKLVDNRITFNQDAKRFTEEYSDLWKDTRFRSILIEEDDRLARSGDKRPLYDRFKAIGDDLRKWRDGIKKTSTDDFEERRSRKATTPAIPVASSKSRSRADDDVDESPSQVIARMARQRGQL